jgi:hypothetical protein
MLARIVLASGKQSSASLLWEHPVLALALALALALLVVLVQVQVLVLYTAGTSPRKQA